MTKDKFNWARLINPILTIIIVGSGIIGSWYAMADKVEEIMPRKEIEANFSSIGKFIESVDDRLGNIEQALMIKAAGK